MLSKTQGKKPGVTSRYGVTAVTRKNLMFLHLCNLVLLLSCNYFLCGRYKEGPIIFCWFLMEVVPSLELLLLEWRVLLPQKISKKWNVSNFYISLKIDGTIIQVILADRWPTSGHFDLPAAGRRPPAANLRLKLANNGQIMAKYWSLWLPPASRWQYIGQNLVADGRLAVPAATGLVAQLPPMTCQCYLKVALANLLVTKKQQ